MKTSKFYERVRVALKAAVPSEPVFVPIADDDRAEALNACDGDITKRRSWFLKQGHAALGGLAMRTVEIDDALSLMTLPGYDPATIPL